MKLVCEVHRLGRITYEQAWKMQGDYATQIAAGQRPPTLLLLEHPHTYTFGRRGQADNLLWDNEQLKRLGISVHWVDRGGGVTYHGPGQLVGYPLLPLAPGGLHSLMKNGKAHLPQADYVGFVRKIETMLIQALMRLGVPAGRIKGLTGVWVQPDSLARVKEPSAESRRAPAKIAAIGVKVDVKGVSQHGFALNINPDMRYWEGIIGCGLKDRYVASLAGLLDKPHPMGLVIESVIHSFGEIFNYDMKVVNQDEEVAPHPS